MWRRTNKTGMRIIKYEDDILSSQLCQDVFLGIYNFDATYDTLRAYLGIDGRMWRRQNKRVNVVSSPRTDVRSSEGSCQDRNL